MLLRHVDQRGFVFHTNYNSRKGRELAANPFAALCFHWPTLEEQIRVEGAVERLLPEESDAYFAGRPRGSQIGAWASEQSAELPSRETLEERYREIEQRFHDASRAAPAILGRTATDSEPGGILVRTSRSIARSGGLRARRRRLAHHAAVSVGCARRRHVRRSRSAFAFDACDPFVRSGADGRSLTDRWTLPPDRSVQRPWRTDRPISGILNRWTLQNGSSS